MSIIWQPPFDAPTGVTATLQAGGNLDPDTTYYVRVYAITPHGLRTGAISAEISFTTTTTERSALLSWNAVPEATHYGVVYRTDGQSYNRSGSFLRNPETNSLYYTADTESFLFEDTAPYYYTIHPFVIPEPPPMGFSWEDGRGWLEMSDGAFTPADLDAAINDSRYSVIDGGTWYFLGAFKVLSSAAFLCADLDVWMAGMPYVERGEATFGEFDDARNRVTGYKLTFVPHTFMRPYYDTDDILRFYGCIVEANGRWQTGAAAALSPWLNRGGIIVERSLFYSNGWTYSVRNAACQLTDTYVQNQLQFVLTGGAPGVVDNSFGGMDLSLTQSPRVYRNHLHGLYGGNESNPRHVRGLGVGEAWLRDITIAEKFQTALGRNVPAVDWYHPSDPTQTRLVHLETTVTVSLEDGDGAPVVGAAVQVSDGSGSVVASGTTGGDGAWSEAVERGYCTWDPDEPDLGGTVYIDLGPFHLSISAEGFQPVELPLDLTEPPVDLAVPMLRTLQPELIDVAVEVEYPGPPEVEVLAPSGPSVGASVPDAPTVVVALSKPVVEVEVPRPARVSIREG